MRTVPFQSVFDAIVRRHGLDPRTNAVTSDAGLAIVEHINARVKRGWFYWEAPDITLTEERAFRQIWNSTHQYRIVGENAKPDEVFYLPAYTGGQETTYFKVKKNAPGDPPAGTVPTNTTYWEPLDPVGQYVAYDQICKKPIGEVLGVYGANPEFVECPTPLDHRPSGRGIEVRAGALRTVFVRFLMREEKFTTLPYIETKTYQRGELVYDSATGECYQALTTTVGKNPSTEPSYWRKVLFPEFLAEYVKAGAYADSLRESDTTGADAAALQVRAQSAQIADGEAEDELIRQINRWQAQGQHYFYVPFKASSMAGGWYHSPAYAPQNGSSPPVTTLTDECDPWYLPTPPPLVTVAWEYHPEIVALRTATATPSLSGLNTTQKAVQSIVEIVLTMDGGRQASTWQLTAGTVDPANPGHVVPDDYSAVSNQKYWTKVI